MENGSEMVCVPKKWIAELLPYLENGMSIAAEDIGRAGHTPSEIMDLDMHYLAQLKIIILEKG